MLARAIRAGIVDDVDAPDLGPYGVYDLDDMCGDPIAGDDHGDSLFIREKLGF
jgi:hypothetical protein